MADASFASIGVGNSSSELGRRETGAADAGTDGERKAIISFAGDPDKNIAQIGFSDSDNDITLDGPPPVPNAAEEADLTCLGVAHDRSGRNSAQRKIGPDVAATAAKRGASEEEGNAEHSRPKRRRKEQQVNDTATLPYIRSNKTPAARIHVTCGIKRMEHCSCLYNACEM